VSVPIGSFHNACRAGTHYGLPRNIRLKGKQVFTRLFKKGKRFRHGNLEVIYLLSEEPSVGFVASKRVGGAVQRNRTKRLLREAYRMNKELFAGLNIVLHAAGTLNKQDITDALNTFKRSK
jgi:ribonuclease P protein component